MIPDRKKTVLLLPGTFWQVQLVQKIKELGHKVLVVNPAPDSPCFQYADGHLQSDIFAKDKVIAYGKENHIDAVMSDECDIAMNLIAELGKVFNVPALDEETAALYTDKFLMREFSKKHGLRYPEYKFCKTVDDAVTLLREINRPIIIKPLDSNASHGVFRCDTEEDIHKHFAESMSFSRVEKSVLAERFIVGTEFTIDGVKTPSEHYTMAISEKKHFAHNESIANELLFSHYNPDFDYDKLRATNDAFVMKSNLKFGFTHAEYKCEDGEFYLIEIAARGGGNMISSCITQWMSGYDTYRYLVDCATGNVHDEDFSLRSEYGERAAILKFFATPNGGGKVKAIEGLDYIKSEPDIKFHRLNFNIGDTIQDALNDSARIGFYIVCSENMQKLNVVISNVENKFKIIY